LLKYNFGNVTPVGLLFVGFFHTYWQQH